MTENKRFKVEKQIFDGYCIVDSNIDGYYAYEKYDLERLCDSLNELNEENIKLQNSLKEFDVFESNRINGAVVTNDDFSVSLHSNNEAYMVCNMLNRFIRSVKDGNKD